MITYNMAFPERKIKTEKIFPLLINISKRISI
jgi:hypothetical protein